MVTCVAYYRTSSASNVGEDKDSRKRQEDAVKAYAARNGMEIVGEYYDAAVKGGESVNEREGFREMLDYISGNGARTILVENASRFARDLIVQLTGYDFLKKQGISLIPVDCPNHFKEETPTAVMVRQILGAVSEFEKSGLVDKLKKARDRKRNDTGRCEGRKPALPDAINLAKRLREQGMTLRDIGIRLAYAGYFVREKNEAGLLVTTDRVYKPQSIKVMLTAP